MSNLEVLKDTSSYIRNFFPDFDDRPSDPILLFNYPANLWWLCYKFYETEEAVDITVEDYLGQM